MEIIDRTKILTVVNRALNMVDPRLVDHGLTVAFILQDMLKTEDRLDSQSRKELGIMALLHDIGAYRTEEIDQLLKFETENNVWAHAIHSYLFLKRYFPYDDGARVVLYHHARYCDHWHEDRDILRYGQMMHIADRVAVWHDRVHGSREELLEHLEQCRGVEFDPDCLDIFYEADRRYHTWEHLDRHLDLSDLTDCRDVFFREAISYLNILVDAIDFRSRVTVIHTRGVMEISLEMARLLGYCPELQKKIYYGGLVHDLGKIGIPVSVLEKPGKLTPEEWEIMKTHITLGEQIVEGCVDEEIAQIGLRHHEKLNGSGYPRGLTAKDLTQPQRLVAVADIVSALCMSRSYKEAFPKERCLAILRDMADQGQLDDGMVSLVEQHFDTIMAWASRRCDPVLDYYDHLTKEAAQMMMYFSTPPTDPLPPCGSGDDRPILM